MKLYHYVHCPFCIRVRMGMGFLGQEYESVVLPYDDEQTPIRLSGKKMLPIVTYENGTSQNESLDILKTIDSAGKLNWNFLDTRLVELNSLLDKAGALVHSLAMPYWIWTPEFSDSSRRYFQEKKEVKRGPFRLLVKNQQSTKDQLDLLFKQELLPKLSPFYNSSTFTVADIMLAAHLWGIYVVPEYQFDKSIHLYLQKVKELTRFNYHADFWN